MSFLLNQQRKKAIAYYRHSAEDKQENSVPLQRDFVVDFLKKYDVELIHEEADEGVSGLTANRPAFQKLFNNWILNVSAPDFDYVVFYDVSRMGRFEDSDEAGYYEYKCKQMGKEVVYARRGFPTSNEHKGLLQVQTTFERWMSFQFSKKLSDDVARGCKEISSQGFSVGGSAPYGMARMLLSAGDRKPVRIMEKGEHKSVANERIIFVPKDDETTETIKTIFDLFLDSNFDLNEIAYYLNSNGSPSPSGGIWNRDGVYRILSKPVYKGTLVYNKTWGRLKHKKRNNPVSDWVIRHDAFPATVTPQRFDSAQERLYWMFPTKHNRGYYILKKAEKIFLRDIRSVLQKADIDAEYARLVPFSLAIMRRLPNMMPHWCFSISRSMEESKKVICISVDMERQETIDRVFLLPTKAFDLTGTCFFTEEHALKMNWIQKNEQIESIILSLIQEQEL
jgi:DNA invertase Pin-like site-specific DNA recombinase